MLFNIVLVFGHSFHTLIWVGWIDEAQLQALGQYVYDTNKDAGLTVIEYHIKNVK